MISEYLLDARDQYMITTNFIYVPDVPLIVSRKAIEITRPQGAESFKVNGGYLIGSAEQSFLQMCLDGNLSDGKYMALTSCFRDDPVDEFHRKFFHKIELMNLANINYKQFKTEDVVDLLKRVKYVLSRYTTNKLEVVETKEGYDLMLNGLEIGSYGIRTYEDFNWVYGTGIAEPRFTQAVLRRV